jgi:DDE superfamily endonuclease
MPLLGPAYFVLVILTRSTGGWTPMRQTGSRDSDAISMAARPEVVFVDAEIAARCQFAPGEEAATELSLPDGMLPPARWQLRTIRASIPALAGYSLSGVWYACQRAKVRLRTARPRLFSPDPDYVAKREGVLRALGEVAAAPEEVVLVFLDEMGYQRWPQPARTFAPGGPGVPPPTTAPAGKDAKHRIGGMLDAWRGRVLFVDSDVVGHHRLELLYQSLNQTYPAATRIYVVQDNWPVHRHPDIVTLLTTMPRITPLWLPLAAWWLNPIEKLWRLLRQTVLRLHQHAADWLDLHRDVRRFLRQFDHDAPDLLRYVGLTGKGPLATALHPTTDLHGEK